jgi:hypothetical protein
MKKNLGILGITAVAIALLLSSCSTSTEEATIVDSGIQARLVKATGLDWRSANKEAPFEILQRLQPSNMNIGFDDKDFCDINILVIETNELAKRAKTEVDGWAANVWQFEDPLTGYGIFLLEHEDDQPCTDAAASAFEYVLPLKK